jgi:hypothetical protein
MGRFRAKAQTKYEGRKGSSFGALCPLASRREIFTISIFHKNDLEVLKQE